MMRENSHLLHGHIAEKKNKQQSITRSYCMLVVDKSRESALLFIVRLRCAQCTAAHMCSCDILQPNVNFHSILKTSYMKELEVTPIKATMIFDGTIDTSNRLICCIPIKATMILDVITRQHYYQTNFLHPYQSYNGLGWYYQFNLPL